LVQPGSRFVKKYKFIMADLFFSVPSVCLVVEYTTERAGNVELFELSLWSLCAWRLNVPWGTRNLFQKNKRKGYGKWFGLSFML
jgi:hypothetical protein